jgi:glutaredoxin 3
MPADIVIYTTPYCPYCLQAKALLSNKRVAFTEIDVEDRPDLRHWLAQASGQRTVPQLFINGQSVGGYTDVAELEHAGELDALLAAPARPGSSDHLPR